MRIVKLLLIAYIVAASTSCQKSEQDLEVTVTPTSNSFIDGAAFSCLDLSAGATIGSIQRLYILFHSIKLKWKGIDNLALNFVRISMKSDNVQSGLFKCDISGKELQYLFNMGPSDFIGPGSTASAPNASGLQCNPVCGGLTLLDETIATSMSVRVDIVGFETDGTNEYPVDGVSYVQGTFTPLQ